jgi:hypothetical protein
VGLTQPLTEMNTRKSLWEVKLCRRVWQPHRQLSQFFWKCGSLDVSHHCKSLQPVTGIVWLVTRNYHLYAHDNKMGSARIIRWSKFNRPGYHRMAALGSDLPYSTACPSWRYYVNEERRFIFGLFKVAVSTTSVMWHKVRSFLSFIGYLTAVH